MSREKIKVPGKVYEELESLKREIHFTLDTKDTVKRAEDRGYMAAANWIRQNENEYKVGFTWGFEPLPEEPESRMRDIPAREIPAPKRTIAHPPPPQARAPKKSSGSSGGFMEGVKNWFNKYF